MSAGSASSGFAWFVSAPCTCLCHNRSHVMGGVVVNVVVPTVDDVRFGVHYGFWPMGVRRWVSMLGAWRNTRRNLPIWISSPLASATDSTGLRLT